MKRILSLQLTTLVLGSWFSLTSWASIPSVIVPHFPFDLHTKAHEHLAIHVLDFDQPLSGVPHYFKASLTAQNPHYYYKKIASLYIVAKMPLQALAAVNKALETAARDEALLYQKANLLHLLQQNEVAIEVIQSLIQMNPKNGQYYFDKGFWHAELNQFKASAEATQKAIALGVKTPMAFNNYGYALTHLGRYPEAELAINEALKREGKSPTPATLDSKGYILFKQGKYADALIWYDKALKVDATLAEVYFHKGEAFEALGQKVQAIQAYNDFIRTAGSVPLVEEAVNRLKRLRQTMP
jgi:tetratricopeptide (TPR) repeat protein